MLGLLSAADPFASRAPALLRQLFPEFLQRQGVEHIGFGKPSFAGHAGAQPQETRVLEAVGVRVEDAFNSLAQRVGPLAPVQIEAMRIAVQFDPRARRRAG